MKQWIAAAVTLIVLFLAGCAGNDPTPISTIGNFAGNWASQDYFVQNGSVNLTILGDDTFTGTMSAAGTSLTGGTLQGRLFNTGAVVFNVTFANGNIYSFEGQYTVDSDQIFMDGTMKRPGETGNVGIVVRPVN